MWKLKSCSPSAWTGETSATRRIAIPVAKSAIRQRRHRASRGRAASARDARTATAEQDGRHDLKRVERPARVDGQMREHGY